jgi:hypothetical protein
MRTSVTIAGLLLLASASAAQAEKLTVYKQNMLRIYGPDCRWREDMPKKSLPNPPIELQPASPTCDRPSILVNGRQLWLAHDEIETDNRTATCVRQARPAGQDATLAGDVGAAAGAAANSVPCTLR